MDGISRSCGWDKQVKSGWDKEIPHGVLPMEQLVLSDKWARICCLFQITDIKLSFFIFIPTLLILTYSTYQGAISLKSFMHYRLINAFSL